MKQRNGEKSQYQSTCDSSDAKIRNTPERKKKRKNPNAHRAMRSTRSRRKEQFSPPTSKQYSSQHELPVRVVPRGGRRTVSVSKKKSTKSSPSHMRERERETEGKEEKRPRTGLHPGLADVDGNNLSHFWWWCSWWWWWWFFLGMFGERNEAFDELACPSRAWKKCQLFSLSFSFRERKKNGR